MLRIFLLALMFVLCVPSLAFASDCTRPASPQPPDSTMGEAERLAAKVQLDRFVRDMEAYRACLIAAANKAVRDKALVTRSWAKAMEDSAR